MTVDPNPNPASCQPDFALAALHETAPDFLNDFLLDQQQLLQVTQQEQHLPELQPQPEETFFGDLAEFFPQLAQQQQQQQQQQQLGVCDEVDTAAAAAAAAALLLASPAPVATNPAGWTPELLAQLGAKPMLLGAGLPAPKAAKPRATAPASTRAKPTKRSSPTTTTTTVNVNEMYSLKKFSADMVARLEQQLDPATFTLERQPWREFLAASGLSDEEQNCCKALRRKYKSRGYAGNTRKNKNERLARTSASNAELRQLNETLVTENDSLRAQLDALRAEMDLLRLHHRNCPAGSC